MGQRRDNREHVDILAENTNLIRKKITQCMRKHIITVGKETMWVEAKRTDSSTENRITHLEE